MFKREKKYSLWLFVAPLVVVVVIFALWALPYAVTETYGLKERRLISLVTSVVLAVFAVDMLIFWIVQYRQTSHDIETLREETEWKIRGRNESENDTCGFQEGTRKVSKAIEKVR